MSKERPYETPPDTYGHPEIGSGDYASKCATAFGVGQMA
jgi:hypothetical protein